MATNERVINKNVDDGTLICRSQNVYTLQEPPTNGEYLCSDPIFTYYIFTTYDSARCITSMIQKRMDKLREILY